MISPNQLVVQIGSHKVYDPALIDVALRLLDGLVPQPKGTSPGLID